VPADPYAAAHGLGANGHRHNGSKKGHDVAAGKA
jgi:hypothetical protein